MVATFFRHGRGRSVNAQNAENDGRMPLTRAAAAVKTWLGCTLPVAKAALELLHDGEWHHVGKFAKEVNYYDSEDAALKQVVNQIQAIGLRRWMQLRSAKRAIRAAIAMTYRPDRFAKPGRITRLMELKKNGVWAEGELLSVANEKRAL